MKQDFCWNVLVNFFLHDFLPISLAFLTELHSSWYCLGTSCLKLMICFEGYGGSGLIGLVQILVLLSVVSVFASLNPQLCSVPFYLSKLQGTTRLQSLDVTHHVNAEVKFPGLICSYSYAIDACLSGTKAL